MADIDGDDTRRRARDVIRANRRKTFKSHWCALLRALIERRITTALAGQALLNSSDAFTDSGTPARSMRSKPSFGKYSSRNRD